MGGDHGYDKFRDICKFIMRDKNRININSYVIKINIRMILVSYLLLNSEIID